MIYKTAGALLGFGGLFLIAVYEHHLAGLIMIIVGVYLGVVKH